MSLSFEVDLTRLTIDGKPKKLFLKQEMNESSDYNRSARQLSELAAAFPVRSPAAGNPENPQTNS